MLLADRIIPLNPGPGATLGPEFRVAIRAPARPRGDEQRRGIPGAARGNHTVSHGRRPTQQRLHPAAERRHAAQCRADRRSIQAAPRAYRDAAGAPIEQRYVEFFEVGKIYPTPNGPLTVVEASIC